MKTPVIASDDRMIRRIVLSCALVALLICPCIVRGASPSEEALGPAGYKADPAQPYNNLLKAKKQWLADKIKNHQHLIDILRKQLKGASQQQQETIQERVQAHTQEINDANAELKTLAGGNLKAQHKLVKQNVQGWIGALKAKARTYRDRAKEAEAKGHDAEMKADLKEEKDAEQTAAEMADDLKAAGL